MDINEIARLAGVSRATVSRYLNDGYVSKEKRKLISRVIEETGYIPSQQARTLRTGKTNLVGVIIPKINSHSVSRMVAGITRILAQSGYQALLANTDNNEQMEVDYLNLFAERNKVDGIILIATVFTPAHLRVLGSLKIPVVILGQQLADHSCVFQDDYHAIFDITTLALKEAKVPGYIGVYEKDVAAGRDRHRAFLDACEAAGIESPEKAQASASFSVDSGYLSAEKLLEAVPSIDTLVCATDDIAFGAITCLREYGKRVPEDVQVTGVGDSKLSKIVTPSLTTVHFYYLTSGIEAAKMLVEAMEEKGEFVPRELKMGYEVYARSSTR
ncbi:MAG: LacI family DNA-binding transcriptional regulator [Tractidigestivibacter sp.]|jgi:LacI family sucrose operon transcriptional repressor|uniref:LacI family DNA-binding transcriptional regulator n=1 Tax=Tractidigestivibacter sp. TaxID=2847320 RepID=UPI003D8C20C5